MEKNVLHMGQRTYLGENGYLVPFSSDPKLLKKELIKRIVKVLRPIIVPYDGVRNGKECVLIVGVPQRDRQGKGKALVCWREQEV